jgi:hypothetical protein
MLLHLALCLDADVDAGESVVFSRLQHTGG